MKTLFASCKTNQGGALYLTATISTTLTFNSPIFDSSRAKINGGAIYSTGTAPLTATFDNL